jgi:hypothetical protein
MQLQRQSDGTVLRLDPATMLGAGGEAWVVLAPPDGKLVAKVYRRPVEAHARKLTAMLANPPDDPMAAQGHVSIAWPVDLLHTLEAARRVVGFLMPRAPGRRPILDYYNPGRRRQQCPLFNYLYLHRTARNVAAAVRAVHARGYVVGDVNESNLLVTDTSLVTLVDTDSFQVREPQTGAVYRCVVGKPEFTPPELQGKTFREMDRLPEHDLFGLGVLIFQLLMEGTHPFAGVYTGEGEPPPIEARIMAGDFPYGARAVPYRPAPQAPPWEVLSPALRELFTRCFVEGHASPAARPDGESWLAAIQDSENSLVSCRVNDQHRYGRHLDSCPWCERASRLGGRDPFPSRLAVEQGLHLRPGTPSQTALPAAGAGLNLPPNPARPLAGSGGPPPQAAVPPPPRPVLAPAAPSSSTPLPAAGGRSAPDVGGAAWPAGVLALAVIGLAFPRIYLWTGLLVVLLAAAAWYFRGRSAPAGRWLSLAALLAGVGMVSLGSYSLAVGRRPQVTAPRPQPPQEPPAEGRSGTEAARAAEEAEQARRLVEGVTASIQRYKNRSLTVRQAAAIKTTLRTQCEAALGHCDRALALDPRSEEAWLQRVRALRLLGGKEKARAAVEQALGLFPDSQELRKQQALLGQ